MQTQRVLHVLKGVQRLSVLAFLTCAGLSAITGVVQGVGGSAALVTELKWIITWVFVAGVIAVYSALRPLFRMMREQQRLHTSSAAGPLAR